MGLETATYIAELDENWPLSGDNVSQGDDHLRLIKSVLQSQFPNLGTDVPVNKTAEELNATDVPVGGLVIYGGLAAPTGWFICDGSAVSRTTYADLYTAIGTSFGAGDGSTTFQIPDMREQVPGGAHTTYPVGVRWGKDFILGDDLPRHKHIIESSGAHAHSLKTSSYDNDSGTGRTADRDQDNTDEFLTQTDGEHTHAVSNTGLVVSADNRQKTTYFNYIIKS